MRRRTFIQATATTPMFASVATAESTPSAIDNVATDYFSALSESEEANNEPVVECANQICELQQVSEETINAIHKGNETADQALRRTEHAIRILRENDVTTAIDRSMIATGRKKAEKLKKYVPLLHSFNNLCGRACEVSPNEPETVKDFLYATLAFGMEVGLWTIAAPYKTAWMGTRYVSNRTFLRFASHGCNSCIALAMSELHWAIRTSVYASVEEDNIEFVMDELGYVNDYAVDHGYSVDLPEGGEVGEILAEDSEGSGGVGGIMARQKSPWEEFLEFDIPDIGDLL